MKKSNLKRVLALALALCMCLPLITVPAFAATTVLYSMQNFSADITFNSNTGMFSTSYGFAKDSSITNGVLVVPLYRTVTANNTSTPTRTNGNNSFNVPAVSYESTRYFSMSFDVKFDKTTYTSGETDKAYNDYINIAWNGGSNAVAKEATTTKTVTHYGVSERTGTETTEILAATTSDIQSISLLKVYPTKVQYQNANGSPATDGNHTWNMTNTTNIRMVIDMTNGHYECYVNGVLDYSGDLRATLGITYFNSATNSTAKACQATNVVTKVENLKLTADYLNFVISADQSDTTDRNLYIDNLCLEEFGLNLPETLDTGSIRVGSNATGLRFATQVNADSLAAIEALTQVEKVEVGTLITLEDYVTGAGAATFESLKAYQDTQNVVTYLDVPATVGTWYENSELGNGTDKLFVGSIVNIKDANLNTNMVGRGYVKVTYNDGRAPQYFYSDTSATKNVSEIAKAFVETIDLTAPEWADYAEELERLAAPSSAQ